MSRGHLAAAFTDTVVVRPRSYPQLRAKVSRHRRERWGRIGAAASELRRRDRQAFPALGAAALQHQTAILGAHPHEKSMGPHAPSPIWLKRSLHDTPGE